MIPPLSAPARPDGFPPGLRIEEATSQDAPRIAQILAKPGESPALLERGLVYALREPARGVILVARHQERMIGVASLFFTVSTAEGGRVLLLHDFAVEEAFRGRGCGSRLITGALDYARERGFLRVTLWAEALDEASRRFFRKHGFADSAMISLGRAI